MKLLELRLRNFRCFGDAVLDLRKPGTDEPLDVALLVGGNGSGKSSCLTAATAVLGHTVPILAAQALGGSDVTDGATEAVVGATWSEATLKPHVVVGSLTLKRGQTAPTKWEGNNWKKWREAARAEMPVPVGLAAYFDAHRLLPPVRVAGPNIQNVFRHRCQQAFSPTVSASGQLLPRFGQLKQWLVNLDFLRAKAIADRGEDLVLWDRVRSALSTLLRPFAFEGVDERFEVIFSSPTGQVPLHALSAGLKSVFVIICEMLCRMSLSTEDPEDVLDVEGLCLIDEIDAHLHPEWQERVIPSLRTLFPNIQIVATTHSPLVVQSVEPGSVFYLDEV